jgi:pSer/pThr/pTyr-binding forkhead associated (FHA) protein
MFDPAGSTVDLRIDPKLLRRHRKSQEARSVPASAGRRLSLEIRGLTERLTFDEGTEIVLGRVDLGQQPARTRFDLTRFGAQGSGVSREHAVLRFQDGQLTITDLDSVNGTTLNLKRLPPNEPQVLSDSDQIMLGRLSILVRFEGAAGNAKPEVVADDAAITTRNIARVAPGKQDEPGTPPASYPVEASDIGDSGEKLAAQQLDENRSAPDSAEETDEATPGLPDASG